MEKRGKTPESVTEDDLFDFFQETRKERTWRSRKKTGELREVRRETSIGADTQYLRAISVSGFLASLLGEERARALTKNVMPARPDKDNLDNEPIVSEEALRRLLATARGPRERAMIAVLYEAGLRAEELCALKIRSVEPPQEWGVILRIPKVTAKDTADGVKLKTGARKVWLMKTEAWPYLKEWLEAHPQRADPNAWLFPAAPFGICSERKLTGGAVYAFVTRLDKRSGVCEGIHPHRLRHTSATVKARRGWNEARLRPFFGWTRRSNMASHYVHLRETDALEMDLEERGFTTAKRKTSSALNPLTCGCGKVNPPTSMWCEVCHAPVSPEAMADHERRQAEIIDDVLARRVRELLDGSTPEALVAALASKKPDAPAALPRSAKVAKGNSIGAEAREPLGPT